MKFKNSYNSILNEKRRDQWTNAAIKAGSSPVVLNAIAYHWLLNLSILCVILIPLFIALDYFLMPESILPLYAIFRLSVLSIIVIELITIWNSYSSRLSVLPAYISPIVFVRVSEKVNNHVYPKVIATSFRHNGVRQIISDIHENIISLGEHFFKRKNPIKTNHILSQHIAYDKNNFFHK